MLYSGRGCRISCRALCCRSACMFALRLSPTLAPDSRVDKGRQIAWSSPCRHRRRAIVAQLGRVQMEHQTPRGATPSVSSGGRSGGSGCYAASPLLPACSGLRAAAFPAASAAEFGECCRVVDTKFSKITPTLLFALRKGVSGVDALAAFSEMLCAHGGEGASEICDRASAHSSFVRLCADDQPLAEELLAIADRVTLSTGGLYYGELR